MRKAEADNLGFIFLERLGKFMARITALRSGKGREKRINLFLDGKFAFTLDAETVAREKLEIEQELPDERIEVLGNSDRYSRAFNAAIQYLNYRPRSESELRERLHQRGFTRDAQDLVITRLRDQGLLDDVAFAEFWKCNRETFSPRSQWLTGLELKRKGIAENIVEHVVDTIDDDDAAYRAALSKVRSLANADYQVFRRRLGEYLKRRGFAYGVINRAVERLWQEQRTEA